MSNALAAQTNEHFLFGDLTYKINGLLIEVHKQHGPFAREKQYADAVETKFRENNILFQRELRIGDSGNIVNFLADNKVVLDLKPYLF